MGKETDYNLKVDENFIKKMNQNHWADQNIKDPNYFQTLFGVTSQMFEAYYKAAGHLLETGRYEEARDAFLFLTFLNPFLHHVWMGAGIAQQALGKYSEACNAYYMAEVIDPQDPFMHANTFQCLVALNDTESAEESLELAIRCCGELQEYAELKKQLIPLQNLIRKAA